MGYQLERLMSEDKGKKGGTCNRTVCSAPAQHYNVVMRAYYCEECARTIQEYADGDGLVLFEEFSHVKES